MFCRRTRKGKRGKPIGFSSVSTALGSVNAQIDLDTGEKHLHHRDGEHYILPIHDMLKGFSNFDPPVSQDTEVYPDLLEEACAHGYRVKGD